MGRRLLVLAQDGSVLASDRRQHNLPALTSRAIALIATGPLDGIACERDGPPVAPRQQSSTLLHETKVGALGCGHWPTLAWRGSEPLRDQRGPRCRDEAELDEKLDLTAVVKRLPGEFLEARWA